jgi:4'-phosphopantetheinyl transferase
MGDVLSRFEPPAGRVGVPEEGEVHVWRVALDPPDEVVAGLRGLLSADESARAERFRFEKHRRRFTVGRGALRRLLGGYLATPPGAVRFAYGEREKPRLAEQGAGPPLQFNLSNSSELALVAVTAGPEVGIDLEAVRPMEDALAIAERFFSAAEREVLRRVPPGERDLAFFRCWTRKEAYLKAVGDGLALGLDRFDVALDPGAGARFLGLEGDPSRAAAWSLTHIDPAPGYLGALALPAHPHTVRGFHWEPTT